MHLELSPLIVWIAPWIVNVYFEFKKISSVIKEVLQSVTVSVPRQRQGYSQAKNVTLILDLDTDR